MKKTLFIIVYLFFIGCKPEKKEIISEKEVNNIILEDLLPYMLEFYRDSVVYVSRNKLLNLYQVKTPDTLSVISREITKEKWTLKNTNSLVFLDWNFENPKLFFRKIPPKRSNDSLPSITRGAFGISDYKYIKEDDIIVFMTKPLNLVSPICDTGSRQTHFFKKENNKWVKLSR